ncbi:MOSC domain-containing protein [Prauserella cavernicola]|uniref:MOSC N-terminal beta barrel domain-containing protein n=1 Tax=Prauserella cavernicola TaxID=2800127 RepID=A0A934QLJ5_9PSEU|nr:MOSC N-terminal beta barrel domain-containing protein [Prauserella cavernicola]MBK1782947.1 MOSC N-terminal beta barrel domain-containing protein [Prauserella cavernicola]
MARVVALVGYPVKGCAGMAVSDVGVTPAGLEHDRSFMVVDEDGVFRSQRRDPGLALIAPDITDDGARLTLRAPDVPALSLDVDTTGARRAVELFGAPLRGIDQGAAVAEWLSAVLGVPSRLVRVPPEHDRVTSGETESASGYADSSAIHLLSTASLNVLDRRLAARGHDPVPTNRFRPNIVVDGWADAHAEDRVRLLTVGETELAFTKLAIRCAVTTVEQETGSRAGPEPLRTLATYRRMPDGIALGVKFAVRRPGKLSVGDEVVVVTWRD